MKPIHLPSDPRSVVEELQYRTEEALAATFRHSLTLEPHEAMEWTAAGVELARDLANLVQARARSHNGWAMMRAGRHTAADREFVAALDILGDCYPPEKAGILRRMATLRLAQESPAEALPLVDEALELASKHGSNHDVGCAILQKGVVFLGFRRIDDAANLFAESLHYIKYERSPDEFVAAVHNLARAIVDSPNPQTCSQVFGAVKAAQSVLPPHCAAARLRLRWLEGVAYLRLGHNRRSVALLTPVPPKLAKTGTKQEQAVAYIDLGEAHDRAGAFDRADRAMARALELYESIEGVNPDAVAAVARCLENMRRRRDEALKQVSGDLEGQARGSDPHPWAVRVAVITGRISEEAAPFTQPQPPPSEDDLYWNGGRSPW